MKGRPPTARPWPGAQRHAAIRVTRRYGASPARVFEAWLDSGTVGRWLFATALRPIDQVEIDARVGGSFCFVERQDGHIIEYTGKYVEIDAHRRLVFTLAMEQHRDVGTRVTVDIAPVRKGCQLVLTHENVPQDCASRIEGRWTGILYGLGETLGPASQAFTTSRSES
jgi:uncharacterized protein YndB with AHSA1/START domain